MVAQSAVFLLAGMEAQDAGLQTNCSFGLMGSLACMKPARAAVLKLAGFPASGYDTTANTLSYALWLLATHPGEQEKASCLECPLAGSGDCHPRSSAWAPRPFRGPSIPKSLVHWE